MKLTDKLETLLECLPESPFKQHLREEIEAIESTVRQQDAELVRELVEALQRVTTGSRMEGESEYRVAASSFRFADAALTRAQQWLDLSTSAKTD